MCPTVSQFLLPIYKILLHMVTHPPHDPFCMEASNVFISQFQIVSSFQNSLSLINCYCGSGPQLLELRVVERRSNPYLFRKALAMKLSWVQILPNGRNKDYGSPITEEKINQFFFYCYYYHIQSWSMKVQHCSKTLSKSDIEKYSDQLSTTALVSRNSTKNQENSCFILN